MRGNKLLFATCLCFLAACSSIDSLPSVGGWFGQDSHYDSSDTPLPDKRVNRISVKRSVQRMPWETWAIASDLDGNALRNSLILEGDELSRAGQRQRALEKYTEAYKTTLSPQEEEALVIRIVGEHLALDRPGQALSTLSAHFKSKNRSVYDVDARFSVLFGYAYGMKGDVDQSFAWFSRAFRESDGTGGLADASTQGVRQLLRSLPAEKFESLDQVWAGDSFIRSLHSQERRRRADGGAVSAPLSTTGRFWELGAEGTTQVQANWEGLGSSSIAVMLPLTGRFASLGTSMKNGFELALEGQDASKILTLSYQDTAGSDTQAAAAARQIVAEGSVPVVMGPLLSDPALAVSEILRGSSTAQVVFSKRAQYPTGDGVFRLGPTLESQVQSLVWAVNRSRGLIRFAIAYPDDDVGNAYAAAFRNEIARRGLELVADIVYSPSDYRSFGQIGEMLANKDVEAIFLPDTLRAASSFKNAMPAEVRNKAVLIGPATWDDSVELSRSRSALNGIVFVSPFFSRSSRPVVSAFMNAYKVAYKKDPNFLAAQGFDAATMVIAALRRHLEEGIDFSRAFRSIDVYEGLTGVIRVSPSGELDRTFAVVELNSQGLVELSGVDALRVEDTEEQAGAGNEQTVPSYTVLGNSRLRPGEVVVEHQAQQE